LLPHAGLGRSELDARRHGRSSTTAAELAVAADPLELDGRAHPSQPTAREEEEGRLAATGRAPDPSPRDRALPPPRTHAVHTTPHPHIAPSRCLAAARPHRQEPRVGQESRRLRASPPLRLAARPRLRHAAAELEAGETELEELAAARREPPSGASDMPEVRHR